MSCASGDGSMPSLRLSSSNPSSAEITSSETEKSFTTTSTFCSITGKDPKDTVNYGSTNDRSLRGAGKTESNCTSLAIFLLGDQARSQRNQAKQKYGNEQKFPCNSFKTGNLKEKAQPPYGLDERIAYPDQRLSIEIPII